MVDFKQDAGILVRLLEQYHEESREKQQPVLQLPRLAELIAHLDLDPFVANGGLTGAALAAFLHRYLGATTRLHHPAYFAHQVAVPHYAGSLAAMVDGFTNNPMAIYEMGPAAAAIEYFIVNWMLEKAGWVPMPTVPGEGIPGSHGGGVLTHGGSLANLTALIAARTRIAPDVWETGVPDDLAILAPAQAHYSIARAAGILGLGQRALYPLEVDAAGVVRPDRLPAVLQRLCADGRRPMALVANGCSTAVGRYDPLREIAAFCREHGIWLHVDGAHGASALLSRRRRALLAGIELADSLIWDAHKMLRTAPLCAAVLVRDHRDLEGAFHQEASYLFHAKRQPGVDLIHRTVECTKAALGLRLFMVLGALGERGLADYVDRQSDRALEAYRYFESQPDFSCPVAPQSNILCFAYRDWNEEHLRMRDQMIADGTFYLSTTQLNGRWYLRLVFMHPMSGMNEVEALANRLREAERGQ